MPLVWMVLAGVAFFALASFIAVYSYGRFARYARGRPSHALALEDGSTALDRMIGPILAQHPGETGMILLSGNLHAFAARAHAARSAGRSLDLQYYYWRDDLTGGLLSKEVLAAADRGVRVRILLDDINTRGDDSTYLGFGSHPNIEMRLFNPCRSRASPLRRGIELLLRAMSATRRMHNKAWIADGRIAIVGGRNIGDAYFDVSEISNFRDMDVLMLGPAVQQTETIFDSFWNSASAIPIEALSRNRRGDLARLNRKLEALTTAGPAAPYLRKLIEERDAAAMLGGGRRIHWTSEATVISDPPEKALGSGEADWLIAAIRPALFGATREVEIVSPYFIPGADGLRGLTGLVARGVRVSVLTNSLAATDVAAVHGAYASYRQALLEAGVTLFELKPKITRRRISFFGSSGASLHTKAFTVDRTFGFVGSFNFDPRSISLNTEMGVLFRDAELANEIRTVVAEETAPERSYLLSLKDGRLVWQDRGQPRVRTWTQEPRASAWRRIVAMVIGLLPIESQL
jgi:putative cardiolipin synthase